MERGCSSGSCSMRRIVSGVRSTRALEVIISLTYKDVAPLASPASSPSSPYSRHSLRKARLVMPAMGASTTGDSMVWRPICSGGRTAFGAVVVVRSEEHTSELQSHVNLVCRLLLEKKKKNTNGVAVRHD